MSPLMVKVPMLPPRPKLKLSRRSLLKLTLSGVSFCYIRGNCDLVIPRQRCADTAFDRISSVTVVLRVAEAELVRSANSHQIDIYQVRHSTLQVITGQK